MSNPFANVETIGGKYLKFEVAGTAYTGVIQGTRIGQSMPDQETGKVRDEPEILLTVDGEERVLSCGNAYLNNWAVANGELIAASVGQPLTVVYTGKQGRVKIYDVQIGGAPAPVSQMDPGPGIATHAPPVQAVPAVAPHAAPVAAPAAPAVTPDAVA